MPTTKKTKAKKKSNNLGPKKKTLFDHINHIREKQTKNYFLSMDMNLVYAIDQLQKHSVGLKPKDYYRVLCELPPQGRGFHKYIKSANDDKHNAELVNLVASHYEVSKLHAEEYIDLFKSTKKGTNELEELCIKYGKEPKEVKKLCS